MQTHGPMDLHYFALEIGEGGSRLHTFLCARDAEEGAEILSRLARGAVAFQCWVDPETGYQEPPEVLVKRGYVPDDALGDPAEIAA